MRLKHHILLYTFLGVAVLISIFLTLDYGNRAQRSAQARRTPMRSACWKRRSTCRPSGSNWAKRR